MNRKEEHGGPTGRFWWIMEVKQLPEESWARLRDPSWFRITFGPKPKPAFKLYLPVLKQLGLQENIILTLAAISATLNNCFFDFTKLSPSPSWIQADVFHWCIKRNSFKTHRMQTAGATEKINFTAWRTITIKCKLSTWASFKGSFSLYGRHMQAESTSASLALIQQSQWWDAISWF